MSREFLEQVDELVRARYPIIYVVTWEEERACQLIAQIAGKQRKAIYQWSVTTGLQHVSGIDSQTSTVMAHSDPEKVLDEILQADTEALYILKDFHPYLESSQVIRRIRDLGHTLRRSKKNILLLSPHLKLPPELEKSITIVDLALPNYEEMMGLLTGRIEGASRNFKITLNEAERDTMVKAALGLTFAEAENAFAKAIVRNGALSLKDIEVIAAEKQQVIRKTEVLEYYDVGDNIPGVGGMDLLKEWLRKRVRGFTEEARRYGLPQPRGILLLGVQGCGKSLAAKTIAASWRLPLLRMDMSRIFQAYIGSSEQNMRKALTIAEGIAPVVLWIDEIEKAFAGASGSGNMDSGTSARVLGAFLTWLQEKTAPVFIVATANQIEGLPPELLRKGRLDEVFFVDLPTEEERVEIFAIHLRKVRRDSAKFDLAKLAQQAEGFSGAEIEQAVISALHDGFAENRDITTEDVVRNIEATVPLSTTMYEKIEALRRWSVDRARPVSSKE